MVSKTKGICKHCGFVIEFITERWIKVATDGVYCAKNPSPSQVGVYKLHEPVAEPAPAPQEPPKEGRSN